MAAYSKALAALVMAGLVAAQTVLSRGGPITGSDWITITDAVLGAALVYLVPNIAPSAHTGLCPPS